MKLRAIPPVNMRVPRVGVHIGAISQRPAESTTTIKADKRVAEMRREYRAAIDALARQFEAQCKAAESAEEIQFWQEAIERLRKES